MFGMKGSYGKDLHRLLSGQGILVPVSGYKNSVDWAVSALFEMNYFDLILTRKLPPKAVVNAALIMFPAAGPTPLKSIPIAPGGFEAIF